MDMEQQQLVEDAMRYRELVEKRRAKDRRVYARRLVERADWQDYRAKISAGHYFVHQRLPRLFQALMDNKLEEALARSRRYLKGTQPMYICR